MFTLKESKYPFIKSRFGFKPSNPIYDEIKELRKVEATEYDTDFYHNMVQTKFVFKIQEYEIVWKQEMVKKTSLSDFKDALESVVKNLLVFIIKLINKEENDLKRDYLINIHINICRLVKPFITNNELVKSEKWLQLKQSKTQNNRVMYIKPNITEKNKVFYTIDKFSILFCKIWFSQIVQLKYFKKLIGDDYIQRINHLIKNITEIEFCY